GTGIHPGSFGESALVLILLAAVYLIATKTASYRIILSTLAGAGLFTTALYLAGVPNAFPPLHSLASGSILFVSVFYATDPVSAPKKPAAQWIYGFLIGTTAMLIRQFSLFGEGTSFAVLLGNTFASLFDELLKKKTQKETAAA
ncbi:MAG TPA: NADH:ubiquinone oxidoreductase, Na translocating, B subunit, partial [Spirochaetia bacterium]|nr:NADH:ubiquinone oxidoreductase, Na translocating, B subunit [Spirochaetia bacterium]